MNNELVQKLKKSLLLINKLEKKIESLQQVAREPIAIVGMACRFPGDVNTPESFWEFLKKSGDGITEVPRQRWDLNRYNDDSENLVNKMNVDRGGYLKDIADFDASFFELSPNQAKAMDPQHRILLEVSYEALENARANMQKIKGSNTGVFISITNSGYEKKMDELGWQDDMINGAGGASASGRLAYNFGFQGPCISVDTACSSSLVATHLACQALRNKECDMALAAGTNLMLNEQINKGLQNITIISKQGVCKSFDADGDGFVRSEGAATLVLKRLSDVKSNEPIIALIKGSAINHSGKGNGYSAPNARVQGELIKTALENAGVKADDMTYLEAFGTGSQMGDPIEMEAVNAALLKQVERKNPLIVGSVKSNIGHTETASGVVSIIKTALCVY